jgi:hypothetical protein
MVSEDSTSRVMVLPVTVRTRGAGEGGRGGAGVALKVSNEQARSEKSGGRRVSCHRYGEKNASSSSNKKSAQRGSCVQRRKDNREVKGDVRVLTKICMVSESCVRRAGESALRKAREGIRRETLTDLARPKILRGKDGNLTQEINSRGFLRRHPQHPRVTRPALRPAPGPHQCLRSSHLQATLPRGSQRYR